MAEYYVFTKDRDETKGWMDGCVVWWRPNCSGYTYDLNYAGIYTDEDLKNSNPDPRYCTYVPKEVVDANSYSPRLAFWLESRSGKEQPLRDLLDQQSLVKKP